MKRFYFFALAALFFAACTTDQIADVPFADAPETLTVSFEEDTRIQLNEEQKTVWTKGDLVSVFYKSDANQKWQFQGETGDRTGTIKRVNAGSATRTMDRVVVAYPYNENYLLNLTTGDIEATLPATQHYLEGSYGLDGNIMVSSSYFTQVSLKNVCGWLKLQLTGNGEKVKSITLKGNNGEQVAGLIYVNTENATSILASEMGVADDNENGAGGNLVFDDTILTEVTLNCGEGVTLGSEATAFYIALPPQTFEKGLTAIISDTKGDTMTKTTDNSLVIERNAIQPMAAFEAKLPLVNNEIWYTSSDGEIITPNPGTFDANIVSNTYENGKGVITFDGKVTSIGQQAFSYCSSLTSITIPESVTSIGEGAFGGCSSLQAFYGKYASSDNRCLVVNGELTSFAPSGLTEYTIPDSVTSIGANAFLYCSNLTSVTIPNSVASIGDYAFYGCASLATITFSDSIVSIGEGAFILCKSLTSVTIPDSVTSIGERAFVDCSSLTSVTIPNGVTSIGNAAFAFCSSLTSVTIPDSVTSIGEGAFKGCSSLTSVTIPDSVTSIGEQAFYSCSSLTAFYGKFASEDNRCLVVNGELTSFAPSGLAEYTIPDSVTSIGSMAFERCSSLTSVTISDSVTSIGVDAFYQCRSLTSVTIGNRVTSIGSMAFYYCSSLTSVYCKPTTPPTGGNYMFNNNATGRKIYVPASDDDSIINAYKSAKYWSNYATDIEEYDFSAEQ